ncbi:MAG: efflux RND transporter periplasmic adaptor subunit [bacterium]
MKTQRIILAIIASIIGIFLGSQIYKYINQNKSKLPFKTTILQDKNIHQTIYAAGTLQIKDNIKIGSLVAGTILDIYVDEGDEVKKGQLLTLIDNGKGDTDVKIAQGILDKETSNFEYLKNHFERQKQLYKSNQLSKDNFENIKNKFEVSKANLKIARAELEKKTIEYNNTKIMSPEDGIITKVGITKGMKITTDLDATVLFEMAKDLTQMEVILDIDESDIGKIEKDQEIKFTVDTFPGRNYKGKIKKISYSSKRKSNLQTYEAIAVVKNKDKSLRPGMTVNAKIITDKKKSCKIISNQAFQINPENLKFIAKKITFDFYPIEKNEKKKIKKSYKNKSYIKFVWCKNGQSFIEKTVEVGITDDNNYEIIKGLNTHEEIIIDVEETDDMDKIYSKWFSKGL